jgi:hypothetical protein
MARILDLDLSDDSCSVWAVFVGGFGREKETNEGGGRAGARAGSEMKHRKRMVFLSFSGAKLTTRRALVSWADKSPFPLLG